jgi:hypothetical protein
MPAGNGAGFTPTHSWQVVPDGAIMPLGCQYRMNLDTGLQEVRIALEPALVVAAKFLELLDAEAEAFVFQTFDDTPLRSKSIAKTMFGTLDQCADPLRRLQAGGVAGAAGVFFTVNHTVGGRRRAEDVDRVRAVFADLDGSPLEPVMTCDLEPHVVVESSPGKYHAYWLVDGLPLDRFKPLQRAIARRFGGDLRSATCRASCACRAFGIRRAQRRSSRVSSTSSRACRTRPQRSKPSSGKRRHRPVTPF